MHDYHKRPQGRHIFKICYIYALLFIIPFFLKAQQTLEDASPINLYNKGVTLFESTQYGAAQKIFQDYLASPLSPFGKGAGNEGAGSERNHLRINAEYYIAISAMEL